MKSSMTLWYLKVRTLVSRIMELVPTPSVAAGDITASATQTQVMNDGTTQHRRCVFFISPRGEAWFQSALLISQGEIDNVT